MTRFFLLLAWVIASINFGQCASIPGTIALTNTGDLSAEMVAGIGRWLDRSTADAVTNRARFWKRDTSSAAAYDQSIQTNRARLRHILGAVDPRTSPALHIEARSGRTNFMEAVSVRWAVFEGVSGDALWLPSPSGRPRARVIFLPDADELPEDYVFTSNQQSPIARLFQSANCEVFVMALASRSDDFSGNTTIGRFTNQPHREWIYRQAYEMGRHIIGYEVQKVSALIDALNARTPAEPSIPTLVVGFGEGGLIALFSAALDTRIHTAAVAGSFGPREQLWSEPIYRNAFGLLKEFGDAEVATLIAPRNLIVLETAAPEVKGPPAPRTGRSGAAPGSLTTPSPTDVEQEIGRANSFLQGLTGGPFIETVPLKTSIQQSGVSLVSTILSRLPQQETPQAISPVKFERLGNLSVVSSNRQYRLVKELEQFTQKLFRESERERDQLVWQHLKNRDTFYQMAKRNRDFFSREIIGKIEAPRLTPNPRARVFAETDRWIGYEVMLDVFPDVYAWGYLLVPKNLKSNERRPVVVCQHGLEGVPMDTVTTNAGQAFGYYQGFASRLADRGFVIFAPHNPYRGRDQFRVLQRKANPLGLSLFSFIIAQHEVITDWLAALPFVDPERIGFYGLSYGGKTAMRVPPVVPRYCLSICSADFNEWIQKNVTTDSAYSYMFTGEYEMPEFNLGRTFNYAEMASLIAPRPFMVERGHDDNVAPDHWVAYEYAKVRRMYLKLGIPERTQIEFFDGPHSIHGVDTFQFLHKHLRWPEGVQE